MGGFDRPQPRRIPFAAVDAYARRFCVAGEAFDTFHRLIGAMDAAWLETHAKVTRQ